MGSALSIATRVGLRFNRTIIKFRIVLSCIVSYTLFLMNHDTDRHMLRGLPSIGRPRREVANMSRPAIGERRHHRVMSRSLRVHTAHVANRVTASNHHRITF